MSKKPTVKEIRDSVRRAKQRRLNRALAPLLTLLTVAQLVSLRELRQRREAPPKEKPHD